MRSAIVTAMIVAGVACSKSQPAPAPPATTAAAPATPASGRASAPPPPLANMTPLPAAVAPVPPDALAALLPDIAGWTRGQTKSELVPKPAAYSRAEAHYQQGSNTIELVLADSGYQALVLAPVSVFLTSGTEERSRSEVRRSITLNGAPGSESWSAASRHGEVFVVVNQRFIVTATGRQVADLAPVRAAVQAVNLGRLASLR
jgi:hypothetical protein